MKLFTCTSLAMSAAAPGFADPTAQIHPSYNLTCPNGAHMALYDDQKVYFTGLLRFITDVDSGKF